MFFTRGDTDAEGLLDVSLDSIYIRIHGTSDSITTDATTTPPIISKNNRTPTRLLITMTQTIEVVHDTNSIFKLFSAVGPKYNQLARSSGTGYAGQYQMRTMRLTKPYVKRQMKTKKKNASYVVNI